MDRMEVGKSTTLFNGYADGLHENDFILAAKMSDIDFEDLLSKKKQTPPRISET